MVTHPKRASILPLALSPAGSLELLRQRYPFPAQDELVFVRDEGVAARMLAGGGDTTFTLIPSYDDRRLAAQLDVVEPSARRLVMRVAVDTAPLHTGEPLLVAASDSRRTVYFETSVLRVRDDAAFELVYPLAVFHAGKRRVPRRHADGEIAEILHPSGRVVRARVLDRTESGAAVVCAEDPGLLFAGAPLPDVRIVSQQDLVWSGPAEVRHVSCVDSPVLGLQLGMRRARVQPSLGSGPRSFESVPAARIAATRTGDAVDIVRFPNRRGEEIVGIVNMVQPVQPQAVPVVLMPPAFGKTKETLFLLALTIEHNFRRKGQPVVVLRYDGVGRRGESYHAPDCRDRYEFDSRVTVRDGVIDFLGALDWVESNNRFRASSVSIVTFSLAAIEARLALRDPAQQARITHWVSCMGGPEVRDVVTRLSANFDPVEAARLGLNLGTMSFLGIPLAADRFFREVIEDRLDGYAEARRDYAQIAVPISAIYGEHDEWVTAASVRDVMTVEAKAAREVIGVPLGHAARDSREAGMMFAVVTESLLRQLHIDHAVELPPEDWVARVQIAERERRPAKKRAELQVMWKKYLLGSDGSLGFDVLSYSPDYERFLSDHLRALELGGTESVLEVGAGTGNLLLALSASGVPSPRRWEVTDLVEAALRQAERKHRTAGLADTVELRYRRVDLELSRFNVVADFIAGALPSVLALHRAIPGLRLDVLERLHRRYDAWLHAILRGRELGALDEARLKRQLDSDVATAVIDLNQAARAVRFGVAPKFLQLGFPKDVDANRSLPYADGAFDAAVASIALPYVLDPGRTLRELCRVLSPGGILVFSTMNPDADMSGIFTRMVEHLERTPRSELGIERQRLLEEARRLLNEASALLDLEEHGLFEFFAEERIRRLCDEAGFAEVTLIPAFGIPPQATIVRARRPLHA